MTEFEPGLIEAIVFDVVGTLVDEDATWAEAAERLAARTGLGSAEELHRHWAQNLSESMDAIISGSAPWQPHSRLVTDSAEKAITALGGTTSSEVIESVASLDAEYRAWPDVAVATAKLWTRMLVAAVSNADLDSLARLAHRNAISWDIALSTSAAGTFKPDPDSYRWAIDALRLDPATTLFVAAHPWDLRAAAEHGFRTAYVARPGAERPSADDSFDLEVADLTELAELLA